MKTENPTARCPKGPLRVLIPVFAVSAVVWLACHAVLRNEQTIHLTLEARDGTCTAIFGDHSATMKLPDSRANPGASRVGLYVYHPYEFDSSRQRFADLTVSQHANTQQVLRLSLTDPACAERLEPAAGWIIAPGRGLMHRPDVGRRSVVFLRDIDSREFSLDVDLRDPVDIGILFRAADSDNGTLFVLRAQHNDAYFCTVSDGNFSMPVALMPLFDLKAGREAVRLAGLLAGIVLSAALLLGLLLLVQRPCAASASPPVTGGPKNAAPPARLSLPALAGMFCVAFGIMAAVATFGFRMMPHIHDEQAYLFQAKIFAAGRPWAAAPETPDFFKYDHIIVNAGRWFAKYPPAFPLLLAAGVLLGLPWLVNPALGALASLATAALAIEVFRDRRAGIVAWLLAISSPFFVVMGGSMMSHMACALFVTLFLLCVLRCERSDRPARWGAAGGLMLGLALLTRPFTAALVAAVAGIHLVVSLLRGRDRRRLLIAILAMACCAGLCAGLYLGWQAAYSPPGAGLGSNTYVLNSPCDRLGFGSDRGKGWLHTWGTYGHTPTKALRSVHQFLENTANYFLGWPGRLSLAFVFAPFLFFRGDTARRCALLFAVLPALAAGHAFYWATQHILFGARYWFEAAPALLALSAGGILALAGTNSCREDAASLPRHGGTRCAATFVVIGVFVLWNATFYMPSKFRQCRDYGGVTETLRVEASRANLRNAIVFIPDYDVLFDHGFFMNNPFMRSDLIFALDLGERNGELVRKYPGFAVYRWAGRQLERVDRDGVGGSL